MVVLCRRLARPCCPTWWPQTTPLQLISNPDSFQDKLSQAITTLKSLLSSMVAVLFLVSSMRPRQISYSQITTPETPWCTSSGCHRLTPRLAGLLLRPGRRSPHRITTISINRVQAFPMWCPYSQLMESMDQRGTRRLQARTLYRTPYP